MTLKIRKIKVDVPVYDITVPETESFFANGILVHNCIEILQANEATTFDANGGYEQVGKDISCNLASQNIASMMDGGNIAKSVEVAIRALTSVSDLSNIGIVPSIKAGNDASHSVGLGQMNLHGFLAREGVDFGDEESIDFVSSYFAAIAFHTIRASNLIARERKKTYEGFKESKYASGEYFDMYTEQSWLPKTQRIQQLFEKFGIDLPTQEDWSQLKADVQKFGMYNKYLRAIPPTGSISYVNNSTSSIHPITSQIEIRKEGKLGRVYYPAPFLSNENRASYKDAYEIGPKKLIDVYAAAAPHVDQGISATLFFKASQIGADGKRHEITTRDINRAQIYAWKKGVKAIYYIRLQDETESLDQAISNECVACSV
jgi:ribonucleoside-diphosphate reductase alpha chain